MDNFKLPISVLVAVKNEEKNIRKCLDALEPASEIVVVDSNSSDSTVAIAQEEYDAKVLQFKYKGGYPKKRQWAIENYRFKEDWLLLLDADEVVPDLLWYEISAALNSGNVKDAYMIKKGFHFMGKRFLYGGFSFSAVLLLRIGKGKFEELVNDPSLSLDMEVHERIIVNSEIGVLNTPLIHEDYKGLEAYIDRHNKYSTWEAKLRHNYLTKNSYGRSTVHAKLLGNSQERRRFLKQIVLRLPFEHHIWFFYHYILRLGFLEKRQGYIACQIRSSYIAQVRSKVYELEISNKK